MTLADVYKVYQIWLNCLQDLADQDPELSTGSSWTVYRGILL